MKKLNLTLALLSLAMMGGVAVAQPAVSADPSADAQAAGNLSAGSQDLSTSGAGMNAQGSAGAQPEASSQSSQNGATTEYGSQQSAAQASGTSGAYGSTHSHSLWARGSTEESSPRHSAGGGLPAGDRSTPWQDVGSGADYEMQ
jgi:hypothetical protein